MSHRAAAVPSVTVLRPVIAAPPPLPLTHPLAHLSASLHHTADRISDAPPTERSKLRTHLSRHTVSGESVSRPSPAVAVRAVMIRGLENVLASRKAFIDATASRDAVAVGGGAGVGGAAAPRPPPAQQLVPRQPHGFVGLFNQVSAALPRSAARGPSIAISHE